jgi:hypothetical protein
MIRIDKIKSGKQSNLRYIHEVQIIIKNGLSMPKIPKKFGYKVIAYGNLFVRVEVGEACHKYLIGLRNSRTFVRMK